MHVLACNHNPVEDFIFDFKIGYVFQEPQCDRLLILKEKKKILKGWRKFNLIIILDIYRLLVKAFSIWIYSKLP